MPPKRIKRRRAIKSCELCRIKKLKCDQIRPTCHNCTKSNNQRNCFYISPEDESDLRSLDQKILEIQKTLDKLRSNSTTIQNTNPISNPVLTFENKINRHHLLGSILSTTNFVKFHDPFYKSMIENCELQSQNLALPVNEISKAKSISQSEDAIEAKCLEHNIPLYFLIRPHLLDFINAQRLVLLFWESELCHIYSFLGQGKQFLCRFYQLYDQSFQLILSNGTAADYIFLGQLLMILRIASLSEHTLTDTNDIDLEMVPLAKLCLKQINSSKLTSSEDILQYIQLMLLLNYYQLHSPEYGSNSTDYLDFDISGLVRLCLQQRYNIDPNLENPQCHMIRKIWFHVLELNYIKFIKDGDPLIFNSTKSEGSLFYTTELPSLDMAEDDMDKVVIEHMHTRSKLHVYFQKAYDLVSDVVNPPALNEIQQLFDKLIDVVHNIGLPKLVTPEELRYYNLMDSRVNMISRISRLSQMTNLLDCYCLVVNLGIPLFYNYKANNDLDSSQDVLIKSGICTGEVLSLNYFMEFSLISPSNLSHDSLKYNINFQLVILYI